MCHFPPTERLNDASASAHRLQMSTLSSSMCICMDFELHTSRATLSQPCLMPSHLARRRCSIRRHYPARRGGNAPRADRVRTPCLLRCDNTTNDPCFLFRSTGAGEDGDPLPRRASDLYEGGSCAWAEYYDLKTLDSLITLYALDYSHLGWYKLGPWRERLKACYNGKAR